MKLRLATLSAMVVATLLSACGGTDEPAADAGSDSAVVTDLGTSDMGTAGDAALDADAASDAMMSMEDLGTDANDSDASADLCHGTCTAAQTCCLEGLLGHCETLGEGESCPMPDLTIVPETVTNTLSVAWEYVPEGDCTIVEGCVAAPGWRRLMRFATQTPNVGNADMRIGTPTVTDPHFEYSTCHMHFHFNGYADYQLNNNAGAEVGHGHKQAFCLLDSERFVDAPETAATQHYTCDSQGIQRGWSDVYTANLDCQWVDVTDVEPGIYSLRVSINYERVISESDYENNVAVVPVVIPPEEPALPLEACPSEREGLSRECGWVISGQTDCTPGATLDIGCGSRCGLGTCTGDPVMRVCPGMAACGARDALGWDDDSCGRNCPATSFVCPAIGSYTVLTAPYTSTNTYTCEVTSRVE